jgi:transcriptional regulator with XRE-family HTH domain
VRVNYTPSTRTKKVLAQLEAETAAHGFSMKSLALQMGRPYNTFRRYVKGERAMPADDLLDALDALGVSYSDFMRRAAER